MSLFLINRYLGDEEDDSNSDSRAKVLLAKLQRKVKEQQSLACQGEHQSKITFQSDSNTSVKKKRKNRVDNLEETGHAKKRKKQVNQVKCLPDPEERSNGDNIGKNSDKTQLTEEKVGIKQTTVYTNKTNLQEPAENTEQLEKHCTVVKEIQCDQAEQDTEKKNLHTGFTILGGFERKIIQKVQRILPQWLAEPDVIQRDITSNLVPISSVPAICTKLQHKLESNGIHHLFPVQAEVIPAILESVSHGILMGRGGYKPRDICVSAPTGSGKTLAFVIPIIQALLERVVCNVRVLAVLPTKELAQQVCKVFSLYAEGTSLKVVMVAGQKSFAAERASLSENRNGVSHSLADIVVATPGRLVDHINKNNDFSLEHLRFLIIDEADRMIDSMHQSWLSQVTKAVYRHRSDSERVSVFKRTEPAHSTASSLSPPQMPLQKLLFSATLTQNPEKLQQLGLDQPRLFSSVHSLTKTNPESQERFNFPQGLTEYYVPCTLSKKPLLILHFILRLKLSPILCFTNSREAAHRLYLLVQLFGSVQTAEFSSRLSPNERKKTLKEFEQGKIQLLISTDAAARGIDINGVKCVVNYDAPQFIRTYIHRVGRTARAGKAGMAFTFLLGVQEKNFLQMVQDAGSPGIQKQIIKPGSLKSMESRYQQTLLELGNTIKSEKAKKHI
ncbi:ATP-dependent RNA helicase DDX51 isoform X1 [Esox lucius]|uniref:ATP-dependent RNA helicase n=1 Tax=Esox lucius TaxID=8010 RepID=A0A3P9ACC2_ESOLU|nr:ATP-dependent RNA helicase DDX51 isoform X1 [Esox lucius]